MIPEGLNTIPFKHGVLFGGDIIWRMLVNDDQRGSARFWGLDDYNDRTKCEKFNNALIITNPQIMKISADMDYISVNNDIYKVWEYKSQVYSGQLVYDQFTLHRDDTHTYYIITDIRDKYMPRDIIIPILKFMYRVITPYHYRSYLNGYYPRYGNTIKECVDIVSSCLPIGLDLDENILANHRIVFNTILDNYDLIKKTMVDNFNNWYTKNEQLLKIMSKSQIVINAEKTIDNESKIPNVIRAEFNVLKKVTIDDVKKCSSSSIINYIWYRLKNRYAAAYNLRKYYHIDKVTLLSSGILVVILSIPDSQCSV